MNERELERPNKGVKISRLPKETLIKESRTFLEVRDVHTISDYSFFLVSKEIKSYAIIIVTPDGRSRLLQNIPYVAAYQVEDEIDFRGSTNAPKPNLLRFDFAKVISRIKSKTSQLDNL